MATDGSLALWLVTLSALAGTVVFILLTLFDMSQMVAVSVTLVLWPLTFPKIVKAKKFKQRHYWLPKSRLLGYFVYLVIPVGVIALALVLAIHFEVGM